jgi:hypothetical protein
MYHSQIVLILKMSLAVCAVVPIMTIGLHVILSGTFGTELLGASVAIPPRSPMLDSVHVLIACVPRAKSSVAGFALPMGIVIHVLCCIVPLIEAITASFALPHRCGGGVDRDADSLIRIR